MTNQEVKKIYYTYTDEAPMLATHSFLPMIQCFAKPANVEIELADISLAGRILSQFPEKLDETQRIPDWLSKIGQIARDDKDANIIKLPNISASIPQLNDAIKELQGAGYKIPDYEDAKEKYAKVLGSAVNPVLREGNSDRRAADAVKKYAQNNPHKLLPWTSDCKSSVEHMAEGDYFGSEQSTTMKAATTASIEFYESTTGYGNGKNPDVLKSGIALQKGEVVDCSVMSCSKLREFYQGCIDKAKKDDVLLSLHLKATMMKKSDPIFFGHAVRVYYKDVFDKYEKEFKHAGVNPNMGMADMEAKIHKNLDATKAAEIIAAIQRVYETQPPLAMVNSDKGITNLHSPNDVIIDASMPNVVRDSGGMWCPDSAPGARDSCLKDTMCMIPDRSYAGIYKASLDFCRENGQFDVTTMGHVPNVGLMAQKAEEYGSHDKTFEIAAAGKVKVLDAERHVIFEQDVCEGDVFRMCQVKDAPIKDWVKLAVTRVKNSVSPMAPGGMPAIFWLDVENRAHDREIQKKIDEYLPEQLQKQGVDSWQLRTMKPVDAINESMKRSKNGHSTISCTGNVLRDYLTDLFPILELGTSAKMLSIVPLLQGGGLYETGAGGSAPKHIEQLIEKGHLRWDSLGEFLALAESLDELGQKSNNANATVLAQALKSANTKFLDAAKGPGRSPGNLCTRGSHFYLCMYWAEALANQNDNQELKKKFAPMYDEMKANEDAIVAAFKENHKTAPHDIGGYFKVDAQKADVAMRPCKQLNEIITRYSA